MDVWMDVCMCAGTFVLMYVCLYVGMYQFVCMNIYM